jgi:hypothetical protein
MISKRYPRDIQTYPSNISMRGIHVYLSNKYPRISMIIQIEYPLEISKKYPSMLSRIDPMISIDIQINIHADIIAIA